MEERKVVESLEQFATNLEDYVLKMEVLTYYQMSETFENDGWSIETLELMSHNITCIPSARRIANCVRRIRLHKERNDQLIQIVVNWINVLLMLGY